MLHMTVLIGWCGVLLYLPALIASGAARAADGIFYPNPVRLLRAVFTLIATPLALVTIASGTALFLRDGTLGVWLLLKLTAVSAMVICHALCGVLILQVERAPDSRVTGPCAALAAIIAILIMVVVWLVLAKPGLGSDVGG